MHGAESEKDKRYGLFLPTKNKTKQNKYKTIKVETFCVCLHVRPQRKLELICVLHSRWPCYRLVSAEALLHAVAK